MGIYDRDYERSQNWRGDSAGGVQLRWPTTTVGWVLLVTFAAYLVEVLFESRETHENFLIDWFGLHADWWKHPWLVYQLLTTALLHSPLDVMHIAGNMLGFWIFGRWLEQRYGAREFLLIYLAAILCGSLAFTLAELGVTDSAGRAPLVIGASGGTVGVIILCSLLYPHRTVLLMFVFPVPMWVIGGFIILNNIHSSMGFSPSYVAFSAHLGGAAFAAIYYFQHLRLSGWLPEEIKMPSLKPRPRLRVLREDEAGGDDPDDKLTQEVDSLLAKIKSHGYDALSAKEKRTLERASREYQGRKRL